MARPSPDDKAEDLVTSSGDFLDEDDCLASGLRRKFLDFCRENPSADECRIYDT